MPSPVTDHGHAGWNRLSEDERRRADALAAFNRAERARERLRSLVRFWVGVSGFLLLSLAAVLITWLW